MGGAADKTTDDLLTGPRTDALNVLLRILAFASAPVNLYYFVRLSSAERWFALGIVATVWAAVVGLAFWSKLGYRIRARAFVYVLLLCALALLSIQGHRDAPLVIGLSAPIIAVLFLGLAESLVLEAIWLLGLMLFGIAIDLDAWPLIDQLSTTPIPTEWFPKVLLQVLLGMPLLVSFHLIVTRLGAELRAKRDALDELGRAQTALAESERLRVLGLLAGGVAHDLNNTLTVILGEAELLPSNTRESRDAILEATVSASRLSRQLLNVAGKSVFQPRTIRLFASLRPTLKALERLLPETVVLRVTAPRQDPRVHIDPGLLQQAVLNLALNARDAMPAGGRLEIAVSTSGETAQLIVSDTGVGMDPATRARACEPFFTTKTDGRGTGLGLPNVHQTMEASGGTMEIHSEPGRGTRVELTLPIAAWTPDRTELDSSTGPSEGGSVLLVEDDLRVRAVAYTMLDNAGYFVREAANVAQAKAELMTADAPEVVVTDLGLPDGSGLELAHWVRSRSFRTAVLIISGYPPSESERASIRAERFELLPKPFTGTELADRVAASRRKQTRLEERAREGWPPGVGGESESDPSLESLPVFVRPD